LTCLRLLTGCFPDEHGIDPLFDEQTQEWHWESHISTMSGKLSYVFNRLLQTDLLKRYSSAQAVLEDLADATDICWVSTARSSEVDRGIDPDYAHLQSLLAAQSFQAADGETWRILLTLACRTEQNNLTLHSLEALPRYALDTIDYLWRIYSQERFGLQVQQEIYQELGGANALDFALWETFAERVGWCQDRHWLNYTELNFSCNAPKGHLPTCCIDSLNRQGHDRGVCGWWRLGFVTFMERFKN
jgi:hypothetical protein